mmetsp:Transcript_5424/g.13878  ORF Transcript_5424/g.13878 Transcript_5424/m.13878 type:complete len:210 (+) Transcript_5424:358-987(+)
MPAVMEEQLASSENMKSMTQKFVQLVSRHALALAVSAQRAAVQKRLDRQILKSGSPLKASKSPKEKVDCDSSGGRRSAGKRYEKKRLYRNPIMPISTRYTPTLHSAALPRPAAERKREKATPHAAPTPAPHICPSQVHKPMNEITIVQKTNGSSQTPKVPPDSNPWKSPPPAPPKMRRKRAPIWFRSHTTASPRWWPKLAHTDMGPKEP